MVPDCSIIIPAYNVESSISESLDSIELNGNWKSSIEVIVVNDGSEDRTLEILTKYASSNDGIIVVSQDKSGVSSARNKGISMAAGRYLFFMDADDTVCRNTLELMISISDEKSLPLVIANYFERNLETKQITTKECNIPTNTVLDKLYIINSIFPRFFSGDKTGLSNLWNKLFLREHVKNNELTFDEQMAHGEDWYFCMSYFDTIESFIAVTEKVYCYNVSGLFNNLKYGRPTIQEFINSYNIQQRLREKYKFCQPDSDEYLCFLGRYSNLIVAFLSNNGISLKEKRLFIRYKEVRSVINSICGLNMEQLTKIQQSRRYRLAFRLIGVGLIKTGLCILE